MKNEGPFVSSRSSATALISQEFWEVSGLFETTGNGRHLRVIFGQPEERKPLKKDLTEIWERRAMRDAGYQCRPHHNARAGPIHFPIEPNSPVGTPPFAP